MRPEIESSLVTSRVVIVSAPNGFGKTTQLPQYAAEMLALRRLPTSTSRGPGLVVCTQPRAKAAKSVAIRIAKEYDGTAPGNRVGHKTGTNHGVSGNKIMILTEDALVRWNHKQLEDVSVLIVDEAQERSLYTDVVLGIAKGLLLSRLDFYVVVVSTTIDPESFLRYFEIPDILHPRLLKSSDDTVLVETILPSSETLSGEQADLLADLSDWTYDAVLAHTHGNVLVFVLGSAEADKACDQFLKLISPSHAEQLCPMVLYRSLPIEKQKEALNFDDEGGRRRMVLFCTNFAETCPPLPNIGLVIDSGLQMQTRFDPTRRIQVIEQVMISKSTSTQRKNIAGRTRSTGVYLPLFDPSKLPYDGIVPEILRSSLDSAILDLCVLGKDPNKFDWISPPSPDATKLALETLLKLKCITATALPPLPTGVQTAATYSPTQLGESFSALDLDPRLSFFVYDAAPKGYFDLAAEIAAIISLSFKGLIEFYGNSPQERQVLRDERHNAAKEYDSDLFYLHSRFKGWQEAGAVAPGVKQCPRCSDDILHYANACFKCCAKYASDNNLNNKALIAIDKLAKKTIDQFKKDPTLLRPLFDSLSELPTINVPKSADFNLESLTQRPYLTPERTRAIATSLALSFGEQACQLIAPDRPQAGVFVTDKYMQASVSYSSTWGARFAVAPHLFQMALCLSVSKGLDDTIRCDLTHPIEPSWLPQAERERLERSKTQVECFWSRDNLNAWLYHHIQVLLRSEVRKGNKAASWIFLSHIETTLYAFGPPPTAEVKDLFGEVIPTSQIDDLKEFIIHAIEERVKKQLAIERESLTEDGGFFVTFSSGLKILSIEPQQPLYTLHIDISSLISSGIKTSAQVQDRMADWVATRCNISLADIKWCSVDLRNRKRQGSVGVVKEIAERISSSRAVHLLNRSLHNRTVTFEFHPKECLMKLEDFKDLATSFNGAEVSEVQEGLPWFEVCNFDAMQLNSEQIFLEAIRASNPPGFARLLGAFKVSFTTNYLLDSIVVITVNDVDQYEAVRALFDQSLPRLGARATVLFDPLRHSKLPYHVLVAKLSDTSDLDLLMGDGLRNHRYSNTVQVPYYPIFSDYLEQTLSSVQSQYYQVSIELERHKSHGEILLTSSDQTALRLATDHYESKIKPIELKFHTRQDVRMAEELKQEEVRNSLFPGVLAMVRLEFTDDLMRVYGLESKIQLFMNTYAKYSSEHEIASDLKFPRFPPRYAYMPVSTDQFERLKPGGISHRLLLDCISESRPAIVTLNYRVVTLEIVVPPALMDQAADLIAHARNKISQMQDSMGSTSNAKRCVYCKGDFPSRTFNICGHPYCPSCLLQDIKSEESVKLLEITCPQCGTLVEMKDLLGLFPTDQSDLRRIVHSRLMPIIDKVSAGAYYVCNVDGCRCIRRKADRGSLCLLCKAPSCPDCGVSDTPGHAVTCAENRNLADEDTSSDLDFLPPPSSKPASVPWEDLYEQAFRFAETTWKPSLGAIVHLQLNESLKVNCRAKLLFEAAYDSTSPKPDHLLAWHGTSSVDAVIDICDLGFDTRRRKDSHHGTGEYFAQLCEGSHTFAQNTRRLIVCAILKVRPIFSEPAGYYVVDNPSDFSKHYCVPLAVVTYAMPGDASKLPQITFRSTSN